MSQLPTDMLGRGGYQSSQRINTVPEVPRVGVGSLNAPGVTALPPVSASASKFRQLANSLGLIGQAANQVAGLADNVIQLERGAAARSASESIALLEAEIAADKIESPTQLDEIPSLVDQLVAERIPEGASKAWRDEYRSRMNARLISTFSAKTLDNHRIGDAQLVQAALDSIVGTTDPEAIGRAITAVKDSLYFKPTDEEVLAKVVLPAAQSAADAGNEQAYKVAIAALGGKFAAEVEQYDGILKTRKTQAENEVVREQINVIESAFNSNQPEEVIRKLIEDKTPLIGESVKGQYLARLDNRKGQAIKESQDLWANEIGNIILDGDFERAQSLINESRQLPANHPNHITASEAQSFISRMGAKEKSNDQAQQVIARLRGEPVTITGDHDKAVMEFLSTQPVIGNGTGKMLPLIDANGNPTSIEALSRTLAQLDYIPNAIAKNIEAGAMSSNPQDVARSATLFWTLRNTASSALDKAPGMTEAAKLRLSIIADRLDADSPNPTLPDGSANPQFVARITDEVNRVMNITPDILNSIDTKKAQQDLLEGTTEQDIINSVLPEWAKKSKRYAYFDTVLGFGMPYLNRDVKVDTTQLPPAFLGDFTKKATVYYAGLVDSGWNKEQAKTEASKRAFDDLQSDYIFAVTTTQANWFGRAWDDNMRRIRGVSNFVTLGAVDPNPALATDRLVVMRRYDNPPDLKWTETSSKEWFDDFTALQEKGDIPDDHSFDEWQPKTMPNTYGFMFVRPDDPGEFLTDTTGKPVVWRPKTAGEKIADAKAEQQKMAEAMAGGGDYYKKLRRREEEAQKMQLVEWVLQQRKLRDQGRPYDNRLNRVDDKITQDNINWYVMNSAIASRSDGPYQIINKGEYGIEFQWTGEGKATEPTISSIGTPDRGPGILQRHLSAP